MQVHPALEKPTPLWCPEPAPTLLKGEVMCLKRSTAIPYTEPEGDLMPDCIFALLKGLPAAEDLLLPSPSAVGLHFLTL